MSSRFQGALLLGSCGVMALAAAGGTAMATFSVGDTNTFSTPALTSTAGLQNGLTATIGTYTLNYTGNSSYGGYAVSETPTQATIDNMETFANDIAKGQTYTNPNGAVFTATVTTQQVTSQTLNGGEGYYVSLPTGLPSVAYYVNYTGYIDIPTPDSTLNFLMSADDAGEAYINSSNTVGGDGSGTPTVGHDYTGYVTAVQTFSQAGLYPIDIFMYQTYGGAGLQFYPNVNTPDLFAFYSAAVPEPATLGLMGLAGLGILLLPRRRGGGRRS